MRRILPSLAALEAFEAVARHGHVTRAAEELGRTQSAVSRQIANLEEFARRPLFVRERKRLVLNEAGLFFSKAIGRLLTELEVETARLVSFGTKDRVLRLGVLPTFASSWLMPRLAGFSDSNAEIELHLVKGLGRLDFERLGVDAAIECIEGEPQDLGCHHLLDETIVAVVAPSVHSDREAGSQAFDQLAMPTRPDAWHKWIDTRGQPTTRSGLRFENYGMMIEAACLGFGVAVLPTLYIAKELESGRLITPFGDPIPSGRSYWLTYPDSSASKPKVTSFIAWLMEHRDQPAPMPAPVAPEQRRAATPGFAT
jgi:LysR family glycine cleavage system transcriptional activator